MGGETAGGHGRAPRQRLSKHSLEQAHAGRGTQVERRACVLLLGHIFQSLVQAVHQARPGSRRVGAVAGDARTCGEETALLPAGGGMVLGGKMLGEKMLSGMMFGGMVLGGKMLGKKMLGGIVLGGKMLGGKMFGGMMFSGMMLGGKMLGGMMLGGKMLGGKMFGGKMLGGMMLGMMLGGMMLGGKMFGGMMPGGRVFGGKMLGGQLCPPHPCCSKCGCCRFLWAWSHPEISHISLPALHPPPADSLGKVA